MDAIHLARAATGRDVVLRSRAGLTTATTTPPWSACARRWTSSANAARAGSVPFGAGHPRVVSELTKAIPFNDADVLERVSRRIGDEWRPLILEPAMMNITIVAPRRLPRARARAHRQARPIIIFDEVSRRRTHRRRRRGRALRRRGRPRLPGQGDRRRLPQRRCRHDRDARPHHHRQRAPGRDLQTATRFDRRRRRPALTEVLTADAYAGFEERDARLRAGLDDVIERYGLPCHTVGLGSKGCVVFSSEPRNEYRDYATKVDEELSTASWLYHMNHGIFMTPGVDEQWTLSVAHSDDELQRYVDAYEAFARDVTA